MEGVAFVQSQVWLRQNLWMGYHLILDRAESDGRRTDAGAVYMFKAHHYTRYIVRTITVMVTIS